MHINIPLSEPLYNLVYELPIFPEVEIIKQEKPYEISSHLVSEFNQAKEF